MCEPPAASCTGASVQWTNLLVSPDGGRYAQVRFSDYIKADESRILQVSRIRLRLRPGERQKGLVSTLEYQSLVGRKKKIYNSREDEDDNHSGFSAGGRGVRRSPSRNNDRQAGGIEQHRCRWLPLQLRAERRPTEGRDRRARERGNRERGAEDRRKLRFHRSGRQEIHGHLHRGQGWLPSHNRAGLDLCKNLYNKTLPRDHKNVALKKIQH